MFDFLPADLLSNSGVFADWCGVLGFGLSAWLAFREFRKRRARLDIQDAEHFAHNTRHGVHCILRFTLSNLSADPISVSRFILMAESGHEFHAVQRSVALYSTNDVSFETTALPLYLQPNESARILALFPLRFADRQILHLPQTTPFVPPENTEYASQPVAGSPEWPKHHQQIVQLGDWNFRIQIHTSKGPVYLNRTAAVYPAVSLLYESSSDIP